MAVWAYVFGVVAVVAGVQGARDVASSGPPSSYDNSWCFKGVYDYDNCPGESPTCLVHHARLAVDLKPSTKLAVHQNTKTVCHPLAQIVDPLHMTGLIVMKKEPKPNKC